MKTKTLDSQFSYVNLKRVVRVCLDNRDPAAFVSRLSLYSVALATAAPFSAPLRASWLSDFCRECAPAVCKVQGPKGGCSGNYFLTTLYLSFM